MFCEMSPMENLIVCIALYVLIVAIAYSPSTGPNNYVGSIDYFPEVEEPTKTAISTPGPTTDLSSLGVRDLYNLAKGKVRGYKKLTKAQLIEALGRVKTAQIA